MIALMVLHISMNAMHSKATCNVQSQQHGFVAGSGKRTVAGSVRRHRVVVQHIVVLRPVMHRFHGAPIIRIYAYMCGMLFWCAHKTFINRERVRASTRFASNAARIYDYVVGTNIYNCIVHTKSSCKLHSVQI